MSEMEEKLGAILSNPQMMQQIMSMAQAMGASQQKSEDVHPEPQSLSLPIPDPASLQKLAGLSGSGSIDPQQRELLKALQPYLSRSRIQKLEKAMRAAKMAGAASAFLNSGGLQMLTGR